MKKDLKTTMANKAHEEIPGNPSVSTSSKQKLNDRSNGKPLQDFVGRRLEVLDA